MGIALLLLLVAVAAGSSSSKKSDTNPKSPGTDPVDPGDDVLPVVSDEPVSSDDDTKKTFFDLGKFSIAPKRPTAPGGGGRTADRAPSTTTVVTETGSWPGIKSLPEPWRNRALAPASWLVYAYVMGDKGSPVTKTGKFPPAEWLYTVASDLQKNRTSISGLGVNIDLAIDELLAAGRAVEANIGSK